MARDQNKKSYKSTLYEAMFYQNQDDDNYEADTEDDLDSDGGGEEGASNSSSRASDGRRSTSSNNSNGGWKSISHRTLSSQASYNRSSASCVARKALVSSAVAVENQLKGEKEILSEKSLSVFKEEHQSYLTCFDPIFRHKSRN